MNSSVQLDLKGPHNYLQNTYLINSGVYVNSDLRTIQMDKTVIVSSSIYSVIQSPNIVAKTGDITMLNSEINSVVEEIQSNEEE